ncbi:MAG: hypothetical protein U0V56_07460 [Actinomycetota bacterium]
MTTQVVLDVMTRTVVAVAHAEDPFLELVRLMREFRVSALLVLDADRRTTIVSESDFHAAPRRSSCSTSPCRRTRSRRAR